MPPITAKANGCVPLQGPVTAGVGAAGDRLPTATLARPRDVPASAAPRSRLTGHPPPDEPVALHPSGSGISSQAS